jgi:hypothetical protein
LALCSPPPVLAGCGSMLGCASAYSRSGRSSLLDAAFHSPAATARLATSLRSRVNAPGLHLRNDSKVSAWPVRFRTPAPVPAFYRLAGRVPRTKPVGKFQLQNSLSVLRSLLPFGISQSLRIVALNPISNRKACPCESPDFPSLPAAPETITYHRRNGSTFPPCYLGNHQRVARISRTGLSPAMARLSRLFRYPSDL